MSTLEEQVAALTADVEQLKNDLSAFVQFGGQTQVSGSVQFLGPVDIRAGRFLALINATEPTEANASGTFMVAEGETFGDDLYNIGGLNDGTLQFGLSALTGKAMFGGGAGLIDVSGITLTGLRTGIAQLATAGGQTRYGVLETFVPEGGTTPAFGMSLSDNDDPTANVVVNGDFETGDLTGWTQTGTAFSAEAGESGGYHLACAEITGADEEIVSDRIAVTAASKLAISVKTKDTLVAETATCACVADTYIYNSDPTTNYGTNSYVAIGAPGRPGLVKYDLSSIASGIGTKPNFKSKLVSYNLGSYNATIKCFGVLQDWVETQATWNCYKSLTNWGTAGATATTDRTGAFVQSKEIFALSPCVIEGLEIFVKSWLSGASVNYGLLLEATDTIGIDSVILSSREFTDPSTLVLDWDEPSDYEVVVRWYDDASAGTLLRTDIVAVEDNLTDWNTHTANLSAPVGALSAEVMIRAHPGQPFYIDDVSVVITTILQRVYLKDDGVYYNNSRLNDFSVNVILGTGAAVISTGVKGFLELPCACTLDSVRMVADASGSAVVDIWSDTYANFPPTDADSITSSTPPTLTAAQTMVDTDLTNWTTTFAAGDWLAFNVDSCATIKQVTVAMRFHRT